MNLIIEEFCLTDYDVFHRVCLYGLVGFVGGYAYNVHYTSKRGVRALPCIDVIRSMMTRKKKTRHNYPEVDDSGENLLEEEILATVSQKNELIYGAI
jgi:hypothetical protein